MRAKQIMMGLWRTTPTQTTNPLTLAVEGLGSGTRRAMLAAASSGPLRRRSWDGCPLNRAGEILGCVVLSQAEAQRVFDLSKRALERFLYTWDHLCNADDTARTALLIEAIRAVEGSSVTSEFVIGSTAEPDCDQALSDVSVGAGSASSHEVSPV